MMLELLLLYDNEDVTPMDSRTLFSHWTISLFKMSNCLGFLQCGGYSSSPVPTLWFWTVLYFFKMVGFTFSDSRMHITVLYKMVKLEWTLEKFWEVIHFVVKEMGVQEVQCHVKVTKGLLGELGQEDRNHPNHLQFLNTIPVFDPYICFILVYSENTPATLGSHLQNSSQFKRSVGCGYLKCVFHGLLLLPTR